MRLYDRGEPASPPELNPFNFSRRPSGTARLRWSSFYSPDRLQLRPPNVGSKFCQLTYSKRTPLLLLKSGWPWRSHAKTRKSYCQERVLWPQLESPLQRMTHLLAVPICRPCRTCVQWSWSKGNARSKTEVSFRSYSRQLLDNPNSRSYIFKYILFGSAWLHHFASRAPQYSIPTQQITSQLELDRTTLPVDYFTGYSRHF